MIKTEKEAIEKLKDINTKLKAINSSLKTVRENAEKLVDQVVDYNIDDYDPVTTPDPPGYDAFNTTHGEVDNYRCDINTLIDKIDDLIFQNEEAIEEIEDSD